MCIALALVASVGSSPNWPTQEFFERQYQSVAPPADDKGLNSAQNIKVGSATLGSTEAPVAAVSTKEGGEETFFLSRTYRFFRKRPFTFGTSSPKGIVRFWSYAGRFRLMGKYIGHHLVARLELDNTFWTDSTP